MKDEEQVSSENNGSQRLIACSKLNASEKESTTKQHMLQSRRVVMRKHTNDSKMEAKRKALEAHGAATLLYPGVNSKEDCLRQR